MLKCSFTPPFVTGKSWSTSTPTPHHSLALRDRPASTLPGNRPFAPTPGICKLGEEILIAN
ncbi:hypothetical protein E2C01_045202 [Portunus trituberculatus]|uniref:Uncharacterized protein n=1 Tax=Portunus trituberculatus TaxID=210409 RepID=A0A5B7G2J0_PORTR|nr:hypothetical protein [Portunus trituberculatus]